MTKRNELATAKFELQGAYAVVEELRSRNSELVEGMAMKVANWRERASKFREPGEFSKAAHNWADQLGNCADELESLLTTAKP